MWLVQLSFATLLLATSINAFAQKCEPHPVLIVVRVKCFLETKPKWAVVFQGLPPEDSPKRGVPFPFL